ncbi:glycerophosphodiester phosphodiesterase [Paenibacillus larvae]|uniref:glycerophosphodiester phosphodiesterase n=1 Tax=Paenibacillus larvae TaxID=1464 RepID=UPI0001692E8E|nr:glycerophosphodiester phosphodiesterase [Paenibacillus larvae]
MKKPLVIGHRGSSGEGPENTLASFALAIEQGCDGVELDIHVTLDGHLVVCHDFRLDRTTDRKGTIARLTLEEIRKADAGSWFSGRFRGERVPLLVEVLDLIPDDRFINVEIKHSYGGRAEAGLKGLLRRRKALDRVIVSSFDHHCMVRLKRLEPLVKVGLLYEANLFSHAEYAGQAPIQVYSLHPAFHVLTEEAVKEALEAGYPMYVYTVNEPEYMRLVWKAGVSGIITNYPAILRGILEEDRMGS